MSVFLSAMSRNFPFINYTAVHHVIFKCSNIMRDKINGEGYCCVILVDVKRKDIPRQKVKHYSGSLAKS